jgi:hypothetical protein
VPQSYVTHGGAAAGQLHLFQKRVLSYRVMLATRRAVVLHQPL